MPRSKEPIDPTYASPLEQRIAVARHWFDRRPDVFVMAVVFPQALCPRSFCRSSGGFWNMLVSACGRGGGWAASLELLSDLSGEEDWQVGCAELGEPPLLGVFMSSAGYTNQYASSTDLCFMFTGDLSRS